MPFSLGAVYPEQFFFLGESHSSEIRAHLYPNVRCFPRYVNIAYIDAHLSRSILAQTIS